MAQINRPTEYFNTKLYTGNGSTNAITGVGFQPDLVWIKNRTAVTAPVVYDAVRGATKDLYTSATDAEGTNTNGVTSFDSDGFSVGLSGGVNGNTQNIASWNWLAGGTGVSNTDGSITSTVSASTTSGFSIVSYTGTGSASTIGHGLGGTPELIIVKRRTTAGGNWSVYNKFDTATDVTFLNFTGGASANSTYWNNTEPTSTVFSVGTQGDTNSSGASLISYCFRSIKGFSKIGTYTGNGSTDGTFVYTGFKPAFVMVKRSDGAVNWQLIDNKRSDAGGNNIIDKVLAPNASDAEYDEGSSAWCGDLLSNGFKWRGDWGALNASGGTYIYMCFAENPLVGTNNVPATAR